MKHKKILLIFFLLVVCLSGLMGAIYGKKKNPPENPGSHYWIHLEKDKIYGVRGQSVTITVFTNYTGYNLLILNPLNETVYDDNHLANTSQNIPINNNAEYGTYRIIAQVPNSWVATLFTVLDVSGFNLVTYPHIVNHKNLICVFDKDWTMTFFNRFNASLQINLKQLRKWVDHFNLDITSLYNSMNFIVKFTKNQYVGFDLRIMFIHKGFKILVNGTLDKSRTFTFEIPQKRIQKFKTSIWKDNMVFDWGDIQNNVEYHNGVLSVFIPKQFSIDPYLYESGFEAEPDFSDWDGTATTGAGNLEANSSWFHHGSQGAVFYADDSWPGDNAYCYQEVSVSGEKDLFVRGYFNFEDFDFLNNNYYRFLDTWKDDVCSSVALYYDVDTVKWAVYWRIDGVAGIFRTVVNTSYPSKGRTQLVELRNYVDNIEGFTTLYVNDTAIYNTTEGDNDSWWSDGVQTDIRVGYTYSILQSQDEGLFADCIVADTQYIGAEPVGNAPILDSIIIENMDDPNILYPEWRYYNFTIGILDLDGDLDDIRFRFYDGWDRNITITINNATLSYQIEEWTVSGSYVYAVGNITRTIVNATYINMTVPLMLDFNIGEVRDGELFLWANDTTGLEVGWTEMQTDYYDIVADLTRATRRPTTAYLLAVLLGLSMVFVPVIALWLKRR